MFIDAVCVILAACLIIYIFVGALSEKKEFASISSIMPEYLKDQYKFDSFDVMFMTAR